MKPRVPRAVIHSILFQQSTRVRELIAPRIARARQPRAMRPRVYILRVLLQRPLHVFVRPRAHRLKTPIVHRRAQRRSRVIPHLIILGVSPRLAFDEVELGAQNLQPRLHRRRLAQHPPRARPSEPPRGVMRPAPVDDVRRRVRALAPGPRRAAARRRGILEFGHHRPRARHRVRVRLRVRRFRDDDVLVHRTRRRDTVARARETMSGDGVDRHLSLGSAPPTSDARAPARRVPRHARRRERSLAEQFRTVDAHARAPRGGAQAAARRVTVDDAE